MGWTRKWEKHDVLKTKWVHSVNTSIAHRTRIFHVDDATNNTSYFDFGASLAIIFIFLLFSFHFVHFRYQDQYIHKFWTNIRFASVSLEGNRFPELKMTFLRFTISLFLMQTYSPADKLFGSSTLDFQKKSGFLVRILWNDKWIDSMNKIRNANRNWKHFPNILSVGLIKRISLE